ncbi:hypothetical protein PHLGIDRAFT_127964 [Phlebiopsis gigantea 11061_1 CR5-6]|uniref:Mitochondrial carrier n=1 Tax=Phlebiopsis gigantea (strain 11061_1 CR5-6) TaxID=745531 RepID=A0A0C3RY37_PHLG1|nr:hypothetical protein PHLGIDRAFT_127964 [Phlebiopsis gigantea 11061_1 CR5-6]
MSSPTSLRDLYAPPPHAWSFVAPLTNATDAASAPLAPSTSYQWTSRQPGSSLLGTAGKLPDDEGLDVKALIVGLFTSALLQYATTAVAVPWDVSKTLLQVQWIPRDLDTIPAREVEYEDEDESNETSHEEESYFADPQVLEQESPLPRLTDEKGYVIRQSVADEDLLPEYVIPVGSASGVWDMIGRLRAFRPEGWLSLWKGLLTTTVQEMLSSALQPVVRSLLETLLSPLFGLTSSSFNPPPILVPIAAQILTGFILSPLDLVRTRLMVQSSVPRHRSYSGPIDALNKILEHEGGIRGVYFHPHLFLPTMLDCALRSVVPFALPGLIASALSITPEAHPIALNCIELIGSLSSLLITIPFETVRRRLQVQVRGTAKPLKACVELRPVPYNGMVDAFWHILTEERSDIPLQPTRRRRKSVGSKAKVEEEENRERWMRSTGLGQLYRGLGLRLGASVVVFVLALLGAKEEADAGWAEL